MSDNTSMKPFIRLGALVNLGLAVLYAIAVNVVYETNIFIVTAGVTALLATFVLMHLYAAAICVKNFDFAMSGFKKKKGQQ